MPKTTKPRTPPSDRKALWKQKGDKGPHEATLPSGMQVTFVVPDSNALIRADMLPDRLAELAIISAAYPDGATGYLADLGARALVNPDEAVKLKQALRDGLELQDWLIAEMLVDPAVTPEEVAGGDFPRPDIEMLLDFAERRRNTDAEGVKLPIVVLEEFATFRGEPDGGAADAPGGGGGAAAADADGGADRP